MDEEEVLLVPQDKTGVEITDHDLETTKRRYALMEKFIKSQMVRNEDYGAPWPGGKKDSLLKPGAEKLKTLFKMGTRIADKEKTIDEDYAEFSYTIQVYYLSNPTVIVGDCEGTVTSLEKPHWNKEPLKNLNNMKKMAQKRAFVGAILSATGASRFYTQDGEDILEEERKKEIGEKKEIPKSKNTCSQEQAKYARSLVNEYFGSKVAADSYLLKTFPETCDEDGRPSCKRLTYVQADKLINWFLNEKTKRKTHPPESDSPNKTGFARDDNPPF